MWEEVEEKALEEGRMFEPEKDLIERIKCGALVFGAIMLFC